mgnify:CR=1
MTRLEHILIGVVTALIIVGSYIYYQKSKSIQNFVDAGAEISRMFYNSKDSNVCLLDVISEETTFDRCQVYLDKLGEDYRSLNSFLWNDLSSYIPDNN